MACSCATVVDDLIVTGNEYLPHGRIVLGAKAAPNTVDNTEVSVYSLRKKTGNIFRIETEFDDPDSGYAEIWLKSKFASWSLYASEDDNALRVFEYEGDLVNQGNDRVVIIEGGNVGINAGSTAETITERLTVGGEVKALNTPFGGTGLTDGSGTVTIEFPALAEGYIPIINATVIGSTDSSIRISAVNLVADPPTFTVVTSNYDINFTYIILPQKVVT